LPDGLIVEDDPGDVLAHRFAGAEQHFAIVAARLLVDATLMASKRFLMVPVDSSAASTPLRRDQGQSDLIEIGEIHRASSKALGFAGQSPCKSK